MRADRLDRAVRDVVAADNCSGCGACTALDPGLEMALDEAGYLRPRRVAPATGGAPAVRQFRAVCPGVSVQAARPAGAARHPTMGPVYSAWQAWAADDEIRHLGSSGGTLTALSEWLVRTGEAVRVIAARADPSAPRRTVGVEIVDRAAALAAAGSRYAPVGNAGQAHALDRHGAVVGKPCEISALRALGAPGDTRAPLLLSFFCAGTPSQHATDSLVMELGVAADAPLVSLWYRGHGWPGEFTVRTVDGHQASATYDESWGEHLGPTVQWRCKICPDGVGEHSDITAADFWRIDARGYPDFTEGLGVSALIARTARGHDVVRRAIEAGVIVASRMDLADLARVQPLQRNRRQLLLGRLAGAVVGGARIPRYRGFGLVRFSVRRPRDTIRTARGTLRRVRAHGVPR